MSRAGGRPDRDDDAWPEPSEVWTLREENVRLSSELARARHEALAARVARAELDADIAELVAEFVERLRALTVAAARG